MVIGSTGSTAKLLETGWRPPNHRQLLDVDVARVVASCPGPMLRRLTASRAADAFQAGSSRHFVHDLRLVAHLYFLCDHPCATSLYCKSARTGHPRAVFIDSNKRFMRVVLDRPSPVNFP
ncbi:uncharacterized protein CLUP02_03643 [Colletotrichum lupini]|uniref:Uncharacterized protein n=1 Tax=Colletotrichum lupini TaxID=145971 RepID=A0A9Q8SJA6_9PEZI|nr:uncharacterized protein CLUP02_03643 [Colletotrichum lupini]UQC78168.1 hypothetical protein CLUP02_03643 [Colletotrichum lupini]